MIRNFIFISCIVFCSSTFAGSRSKVSSPDFYGVIFGITLDKTGDLVGLRVTRVMDPREGPKSDVKLKVPKVFVKKAREQIIKNAYKPKIVDGKPIEFFTYFIYDPDRPDRIDIDPRKEFPRL